MRAKRPRYYASCYCEENAWQLAQDGSLAVRNRHVVFVSNHARAVPVFRQRAAPSEGEPVVWDYHVVMLGFEHGWWMFDLDSTLPFPVPAERWIDESFPSVPTDPDFQVRLRVVEAQEFVLGFASDRSHMRRPDGGFTAEPPAHAPIRTSTETMNLWRWVDMRAPYRGEVMDLDGLRRWLAAAPSLSAR